MTLLRPANRGRNLTVSDAMIVVAATAVGLALMRRPAWWPDPWEDFGKGYADSLYLTRDIICLVSSLFATWSLAFLLLRLRRPRPVLRRLVRQPGMVGLTVASVLIGIRLINALLLGGVFALEDTHTVKGAWRMVMYYVPLEMPLVPSEIGCAVAAAWTIQALGGRWRPEPSWIDRAGRILGACWIVTIPFSWFQVLCRGG